MLIIANINVNNLDLDSLIQCLYLINNLQESLINLHYYYLFKLQMQLLLQMPLIYILLR